MHLLIDENAPRPLVEMLKNLGYGILWIREHQRGMTDEEIICLSEREARVLITFDKDFGELIYRSKRAIPGVILVRIADSEICNERVSDLLEKHPDEIEGYFTVLTERRIRRRSLP